MKQTLAMMLCITAVGCRLPEEREGLRPLPDKGNILTYQEMHQRAMLQAGAALAAFYNDNWLELEQMAQVLEQTARLLPNSTGQPDKVKQVIAKDAASLRTLAVGLGEAAKAKNEDRTSKTMEQIHLIIRGLRPQK